MKTISKIFLYVCLIVMTMPFAAMAQQKTPSSRPVVKKVIVPSNAMASNVFSMAVQVTTHNDVGTRSELLVKCITAAYIHRSEFNDADAKLIEAELLKTLTQDELDKMLNFGANCCSDYSSGLLCPKSLGMDKLFVMYDKALKKSGRKTAYAIFKRTNGEYPINSSKVFPASASFLRENVKSLSEAIGYMNEELYYPIDPLAKVIAHELVILKQRQLIDDGYSVVYKAIGNGKRQYSEGAELLLTYCNRLVDSFNSAYFIGLNARLEEVGRKERFNNKYLLNSRDAQDLSKKVLYGDACITSTRTRWMLRMTCGVLDFNALIDRINNGNKVLREAAQKKLPENAKPVKR